jgi:hypothetical protein
MYEHGHGSKEDKELAWNKLKSNGYKIDLSEGNTIATYEHN